MKTPEGKAHRERKEAAEKSAKPSIDKDVVVAPRNQDERQHSAPRNQDDRPRSSRSSSLDDQEQVSKQLGAHTGDLPVPDENADSPDHLAADPTDSTTTVKREQSEGSMDELVLVRSPFFPSPSQVAAEAEAAESDEEE